MPRIIHNARPDMRVPADYGGTLRPDCGVVQVAVAAGVPMDKARKTLRVIIRETRPSVKRWHGGTTLLERTMALKILGVEVRKVKLSRRMQLRTWAATERRSMRKRYLVQTTGHAQIVRGSLVVDQSGTRRIEDSTAARSYVRTVFEIVE